MPDDPVADPLTTAAAAVLTGDPNAADAVAATARRVEVGEVKAERDTLLSKVDKLTAELERLRGELTEARAQVRAGGPAARGRVPPAAQAAVRAGRHPAHRAGRARGRGGADGGPARRHRGAGSPRPRPNASGSAAGPRPSAGGPTGRPRRSPRPARPPARPARPTRRGFRCWSTRSAGAVAGLRRELALGGGGPRPADLVAGAQASRSGTRVDTVPGLDALLAVPTTAPRRRRLQRQQDRLPRPAAGRPAQPADHPARRARRPHPGGGHRGVRRRGGDGRAPAGRAGGAGAVQRAGRARRRRHPLDRRRRAARAPGRGRHLRPGRRGLCPVAWGPTRCPRRCSSRAWPARRRAHSAASASRTCGRSAPATERVLKTPRCPPDEFPRSG